MGAGTGVQTALLPDGRRLHLNHGPIDLVIEGFGPREEIRRAYAQAVAGFPDVLSTLVGELDLLRAPLGAVRPCPAGPVARRMVAACWPYRAAFITPMAAVAGAVADHILARMLDGRELARAYVNDGGDIAFHLGPGERFACGLVADLAAPRLDRAIALEWDMAARGLATSGRAAKGRGGRSFSLGIADAVTVLAADAAAADAAATVVANAVDLPGHAAVVRVPASDIDPDSDLGDTPVTLDLGPLGPADIGRALGRGAAKARSLIRAGLIGGAVLVLRGREARIGPCLAS
ncbi:MAG: UPF0280 family protein [Pseudomonadota bacterium]